MKIRSLLLGSAALCGLATSGYAADLGIVTSLDITGDGSGHDFDSFMLGGASTNTMAVAMTPDPLFGGDQGGHMSGDSSIMMDSDIGHSSGALQGGGSGLTLDGPAGGGMLPDPMLGPVSAGDASFLPAKDGLISS